MARRLSREGRRSLIEGLRRTEELLTAHGGSFTTPKGVRVTRLPHGAVEFRFPPKKRKGLSLKGRGKVATPSIPD